MRRLLLTFAALPLALAALPAAATEGAADDLPDLDEIDPVRYDYDDAVVEWAVVPTRDGVGHTWVDIIRPDADEPVPTILIASPYFNTLGRGWRSERKAPHRSGPLGDPNPAAFPEWYDGHFVPRGYAVALMDLRGTRNSSGCQEYGDRKEVYGAVDVIDWIADQPWSNGKVGMTGGSYDGTIATGAAAEAPRSGRHPDALGAIIPIRAIDRWYDYAFVNGVQILGQSLLTPSQFTAFYAAQDTQNSWTDDPLFPVHVVERKACIPTFGAATSAGHAAPYQDADSDFWRGRDFVRDADGFRAATFIIHALFDFNVKPHNAGYLWDALPEDLPKQLWLHWGAHGDPHQPHEGGAIWAPFQDKFIDATHRWFAQFLKGLDAGALATPAVEVQQPDGSWLAGEAYPAADDDLELTLPSDLAFADGFGSGPSSVTVSTETFSEPTRISGEFGFDLDVSAQGPDTTIAVTVRTVDAPDVPTVLTYGWLRAAYRDSVSLRGRSTPSGPEPLVPGETFTAQFGSLHTDVVLPVGSRLEFTFSASAGGTLGSGLGRTVTLAEGSRILIPYGGVSISPGGVR